MKQLQQTTMLMGEPNRRAAATIGFRLESDERELLAARAESLGISPHELARHYVQFALQDESEKESKSEVMETLGALLEGLLELRKDIAISTEANLTSAGKVTENDARTWVKTNLSSK